MRSMLVFSCSVNLQHQPPAAGLTALTAVTACAAHRTQPQHVSCLHSQNGSATVLAFMQVPGSLAAQLGDVAAIAQAAKTAMAELDAALQETMKLLDAEGKGHKVLVKPCFSLHPHACTHDRLCWTLER